MITHDELVRLMRYDPINGSFTWNQNQGRIRSGATAGSIRKDGYVQIMIDREFYLAHRLAWFYITEEWPTEQIDHKNRNKADNSFSNLRLATNKQNGENLPLFCTNSSGYRGVSWDTARKKWRAQIKHHQQNIYLGRFDLLCDAVKTVKTARANLFTHCDE